MRCSIWKLCEPCQEKPQTGTHHGEQKCEGLQRNGIEILVVDNAIRFRFLKPRREDGMIYDLVLRKALQVFDILWYNTNERAEMFHAFEHTLWWNAVESSDNSFSQSLTFFAIALLLSLSSNP